MTDSTTVGATASTAKDQAAGVASDAKEAGARVAGTARDETSRVAHEASGQAKQLARQTADELREQAGIQQTRAADGLRAVSESLQQMADGSDEQGLASDVVRQVAQRTGSVAEWLGDRDPGSLLSDVKQFARSRPGAFIAIAAGAGILAGRLTKSLLDSGDDSASTGASTGGASSTPTVSTPPVSSSSTDERTFQAPTLTTPTTTAPASTTPTTPVYEDMVETRGGNVLP